MKTEILRYINISVNLVGIFVIISIIACLSTGENRANKSNKLFIRGLFSCIAYMLGEAVAWWFKGNSGYILILFIANDIVFISGYLILITFTDYLRAYLSENNSLSRIIIPLICSIGGAGLFLIIINHLNGMIYIIDKNGYYQRGDYILISQFIVMIGIFIDTWMVWKYRRKLGRNRLIIMMAYTVMPFTAVTLQLVIYGIPMLSVGFLLFSVMVFTGIQSQQAKLIKEQELENQEQRIAVMLSQIQPHFLFNVLLSIKYLCKTDPEAAGEVVDQFSHYLRRNLESLENKKPIPFSEELEHVKTYLFLEKRRYKDLLRLEFDIQTTAFSLPALTIQPLVENAVRHGVAKKETGGIIRIATRENENDYEITITDDGVGFEPDLLSKDGKVHIGINNVSRRLALQCGASLSYLSEVGKGTIMTIKIKK